MRRDERIAARKRGRRPPLFQHCAELQRRRRAHSERRSNPSFGVRNRRRVGIDSASPGLAGTSQGRSEAAGRPVSHKVWTLNDTTHFSGARRPPLGVFLLREHRVCDEAGVHRSRRSASRAGQVGEDRAGELVVGDDGANVKPRAATGAGPWRQRHRSSRAALPMAHGRSRQRGDLP